MFIFVRRYGREWKILHSYLHVFYEIINGYILKMGNELKNGLFLFVSFRCSRVLYLWRILLDVS
jgi:hypothetical protein